MIKASIGGTVKGVGTLDEPNCLRVNIHSQELPDDIQAKLLKLKGLYCSIEIEADDMSSEITKIVTDKKAGQKSASQRQLNLLYVIWKLEGEVGDFNSYYAMKMKKNEEYLKSEIKRLEAKKSGLV